MAKDYAKYAETKRQPVKSTWRIGVLAGAVLCVVLIILGVWLYLHKAGERGVPPQQEVARAVHFDFYPDSSNVPVTVATTVVAASPTPPAPASVISAQPPLQRLAKVTPSPQLVTQIDDAPVLSEKKLPADKSFNALILNHPPLVPNKKTTKSHSASQIKKATQVELSQPPVQMPVMAKAVMEQYILQVGVFKESSRASDLRISLLLAGIETVVVKAGDVYRVEQGPYGTETLAKNAREHLVRKGFDGVIRKIG